MDLISILLKFKRKGISPSYEISGIQFSQIAESLSEEALERLAKPGGLHKNHIEVLLKVALRKANGLDGSFNDVVLQLLDDSNFITSIM